MNAPVPRRMISCYVRHFSGWAPLRGAIAAELRIGVEEVLDLSAGGPPPPVYIEARTQHGEFKIFVELFVDTARVKAYGGQMAFLLRLSRALGEDLLCDDGLSPNPYRWVLIKPDGSRFEVFEATDQPPHMLVLDPVIEPRLIYDEAFFESRRHLPNAERTLDELEWELNRGSMKFWMALDLAQDPGPDGFARFGEWESSLKAEIERRKTKDR